MSQRQLKYQYRWKGPARFKNFFEHNRFGFALNLSAGITTFFFLLGVVGTTVLCLIGSLFFGVDAFKGANPLVWGVVLAVGNFPFVFAAGLTTLYKDRLEVTKD
jgi:hypothetical protein